MEPKELEITDDIKVIYVKAETFPEGITAAFDKLETITGLKNRHVYGITECTGEKLAYMACVKEEFDGEAVQLGLPVYEIPKGKYFYYTLKNWRENIDQIPQLFAQFDKMSGIKKQTICLEDYIGDDEMLVMVQQA